MRRPIRYTLCVNLKLIAIISCEISHRIGHTDGRRTDRQTEGTDHYIPRHWPGIIRILSFKEFPDQETYTIQRFIFYWLHLHVLEVCLLKCRSSLQSDILHIVQFKTINQVLDYLVALLLA